jgi:hypothetical protein
MALKDYTIKFTDSSITGKSDILVYENSINDTSTTLELYGYGHKDYGAGLWQNMLHIMENFASASTAPAYPTVGQLWYNSGKKSLLIYVGTDDTAASNGWKNIVSNYDFSNNVSSGTPTVQYLTKSDLIGYLTPEVTQQLTGNLVLKNNDSWYTTVDGNVRLDTSATIPGNYAASVRYVNVKVDTVVTEKLTTMNNGNNVSADNVNTALSSYDTTGSPVGSNHLYIRRVKNSPVESRTMYDNLILPEQTATVIPDDDNYAATKGFVRSVLSSSKSIVTSTTVETIAAATSTDVITGTASYLPLAGGTLTGKLYLVSDETGYSDINKTRAASRAYVDYKYGLVNSNTTVPVDVDAKITAALANVATETYVNNKITTAVSNLATESYVNDKISLALSSPIVDPALTYATETYVNEKITTAIKASTTATSTITTTTSTDIISPPNKDFTDAEKLNNKDRELISYTKLPDGTLMVYGYYRNFGVSYKDNGKYASSLSKITFPDNIKFTNNYYAVSITEEVPTVTLSPTAPSGKSAIVPYTYKSCDNLRRSGLWSDFNTKYPGFYQFRGAEILNNETNLKLTYLPTKYNQPVSENYNVANTSLWDKHWAEMSKVTTGSDFTAIAPTTFSVFEKETNGFRLSAYNDNGGGGGAGLTYLFWRNFVACNFTAIGRWK